MSPLILDCRDEGTSDRDASDTVGSLHGQGFCAAVEIGPVVPSGMNLSFDLCLLCQETHLTDVEKDEMINNIRYMHSQADRTGWCPGNSLERVKRMRGPPPDSTICDRTGGQNHPDVTGVFCLQLLAWGFRRRTYRENSLLLIEAEGPFFSFKRIHES